MNLDSIQVNYIAVLIQDHIEDKVYVKQPQRFKEDGMVLKLNKVLYGVKKATQNVTECFLIPAKQTWKVGI